MEANSHDSVITVTNFTDFNQYLNQSPMIYCSNTSGICACQEPSICDIF